MSSPAPSWKTAVRDMLPPGLVRLVEQRMRGVRYEGDFPDWESARNASSGYDAPVILERVAEAARKVRDGRAAYERDGVTFEEPAYVWPVLACLLRAAARHGGRLSVVDFGGSLGSFYFQHRKLLGGLGEVRWTVVEQDHYVELGRREFATEELRFCPTIAAAAENRPSVILFSGVLAWLPDPGRVIADALGTKPDAIIVARTPVIEAPRDRLRVQVNSPGLGGDSYPCWHLARAPFLAHFGAHFSLMAEWRESDVVAGRVPFRGFCFERNAP